MAKRGSNKPQAYKLKLLNWFKTNDGVRSRFMYIIAERADVTYETVRAFFTSSRSNSKVESHAFRLKREMEEVLKEKLQKAS